MRGLRQDRRILIIDDNRTIHDDFRKILCGDEIGEELARAEAALFGEDTSQLPQIKYHIDDAYQGPEGLEKVVHAVAHNQPFDMAFVDMRMPPGWDGVETIERVWQKDAELQIVICTAYADHSWSEIFGRLGRSDNLLILKKPFDHVEVSQLAAALTEKRRLGRQAKLRVDELKLLVDQRTAELHDKDVQLRQKRKLEAIGSLAGGVAHEFNNMLQVIRGYVSFAKEELQPEQQASQDLDKALDASRRAASITSQLLNFSRQQPLQRERLELNKLVTDAIETFRPLLGEHIELDVHLDEPSATVFADSPMMHQVLMNLCINARDAIPTGGELTVSVSCVRLGDRRGDNDKSRPDLAPGHYALLTVTDSGCGMPPDVMQRIFEPFFTTKEVGKGTGLGLSMVYGAIEQHDGAIQVDSESGIGTTFQIYLPIVEETHVQEKRQQDEERSAGNGERGYLIAESKRLFEAVR